LYQSKNNAFLICECKLNPFEFVKSPKTGSIEIKWHTNIGYLDGRAKLKLREVNSRRLIEQTNLENHPIKIMKKDTFDLMPFISAKIEIAIDHLNSSKYSCCVEFERQRKNKSPYLCSFISLERNSSSWSPSANYAKIIGKSYNQTENPNTLSHLEVNEIHRILRHFSKIIFARQLLTILSFFLVIIVAIAVWYKCLLLKKKKNNPTSPDIQMPIINDENSKMQIGTLTEKQLKAFNQNAVLNPKRLDFNKNPIESPELAPPTYNQYVSEFDRIKE
jgi:hypothetical protein